MCSSRSLARVAHPLLVVLLGLGLAVGGLGAPAQARLDTQGGATQAQGGAAQRVTDEVLPIEDYAGYQPQTKCSPRAKPGAKALLAWLVERGGRPGPISRACRVGGTSEHKEGRAVDWMLDHRRKKERRIAKRFLREAFATDEHGNTHALARRMGIMYVIWNDRIWRSYSGFSKDRYLSAGCRSRKRCSRTLRHRDHVHISLSRKGGKGRTSWYADGAGPV